MRKPIRVMTKVLSWFLLGAAIGLAGRLLGCHSNYTRPHAEAVAAAQARVPAGALDARVAFNVKDRNDPVFRIEADMPYAIWIGTGSSYDDRNELTYQYGYTQSSGDWKLADLVQEHHGGWDKLVWPKSGQPKITNPPANSCPVYVWDVVISRDNNGKNRHEEKLEDDRPEFGRFYLVNTDMAYWDSLTELYFRGNDALVAYAMRRKQQADYRAARRDAYGEIMGKAYTDAKAAANAIPQPQGTPQDLPVVEREL